MNNRVQDAIFSILESGASLGLGIICQSVTGECLGKNTLIGEWFGESVACVCGAEECEDGLVITDELGRSLEKGIFPSVQCRKLKQDQPTKLIAVIEDGATPFWYEISASYRCLPTDASQAIIITQIRPVTALVAENARLHGSHLLAMASTDAVLLLDDAGQICIANPACDRLFWLPSRTLLGLKLGEVWPDREGWESIHNAIRLTFEGSTQHLVTWSEIGRLGWRCIDIRMAPSFNMLGEIDGVLMSIRDISESTQKLRMMSQIQSMTKMGTWILFPSMENGYWDEMAYRLHGLEINSIVPSLLCADLFYEMNDAAQFSRAVKQCFSDGTGFELDLKLIQTGVKGHWLRVTASPEWRDGKVIKIIGTFQEITDLRAHQEQLTMGAVLFDSMNDPVAIADADQTIVAVNPCFERETGCVANEILGRKIVDVARDVVQNKPMLSRPKVRAINDDKGQPLHHIVVW